MAKAEDYIWEPQECPVCGAAPKRYLGRRGGAAHRAGLGVECRVVSCRRCALIFPDPMPHPKGGLDQHYATDADEYFEHHASEERERQAQTLLREAAELTGGTGRLLDVGSGRGELLKVAHQNGWKAVGVEPSPTFAAYAERCSGAKVIRTSFEQFESDAQFDAVILAAVLEHVYDPTAVIRKVSGLLRSGGVMFVDVPNEQGLYFRLGNLYQKLRRRDWVVNLAPTFSPFHTFGFGPASLRRILSVHELTPTRWRIYSGRSWLLGGKIAAASMLVHRASVGVLGNYIEAWARKE